MPFVGPLSFFTFNTSFCILGVIVGSMPFVESFRCFYIQYKFLYFKCSSGFYVICGILGYKGVLQGFQHHN
jgi:hypothetical protein